MATRMADLKLKDLRYLAALADTRHFGQAAAACFVSQPTLSAQLRKLEDYLGVQLVERQPRRVALTEAGVAIAARARQIVATSDEIVRLARDWRDPLAGQLRVATLPTVGPYLLPQVMVRLRKALPRLELLLFEYQTGADARAPARRRTRSRHPRTSRCTRRVSTPCALYDEPFLLAVPEQHRLAARRQVQIGELEDDALLLLDEGHCLRDQALAVCARSRAREMPDFRATSLETLRQMVAAGAGVTLLPALACRGIYGASAGLRLLNLVKPTPTRRVGAIWRRSTARLPAISAFCDLLVRHSGIGRVT